MDYLNLLPDELLIEILLKTDDLKTLSSWCQTSKRINLICQDEGFWKQKYLKDYGETTLMKEWTWKELYKQRALSSINSPISAGEEHYAIIDQAGILYMAGDNTEGQLGKGLKSTHHSVVMPFPFKGLSYHTADSKLSKIISVACGLQFTIAVTENGKAYWWGRGFITSEWVSEHPRLIKALKSRKAVKISAEYNSYAVILDDGSAYIKAIFDGWGLQRRIIDDIFPLNALDISMAANQLYIISKDYQLYMFGHKKSISLGGSDRHMVGLEGEGENLKINPIHIPLPEPVKQVSAGFLNTLILLRSGTVHKLNYNNQISPKLNLPPISQIQSSYGKMAAITRDGKLYMWGAYGMGEIIDNEIGSKLPNVTLTYPLSIHIPSPIQIDIGLPVKYVAMGGDFTIAVTSDGAVNYWGTPTWAPE